jgi:hypothetical protein
MNHSTYALSFGFFNGGVAIASVACFRRFRGAQCHSATLVRVVDTAERQARSYGSPMRLKRGPESGLVISFRVHLSRLMSYGLECYRWPTTFLWRPAA